MTGMLSIETSITKQSFLQGFDANVLGLCCSSQKVSFVLSTLL